MELNKLILMLFPLICQVEENKCLAMDLSKRLGKLVADHGLGDERSPAYDYENLWKRKFWLDRFNYVFVEDAAGRRAIGKIAI